MKSDIARSDPIILTGAESIEWYHRFIETGGVNIKNRILKYNEDDCIATRVLLEGIHKLPLLQSY